MESAQNTKHRTAWMLVLCSAIIATSAWADNKVTLDKSNLLPRDIEQIDMFEQSLADYLKENPNAPKLPQIGEVPDNVRVQRHLVVIDGEQTTISTKGLTAEAALNSQISTSDGEKAVYSNTLYDLGNLFGLTFIRPGTGVLMADDIGTDLVDACTLRRVRFAVNGGVPGGGGVFTVLFNIYDGCPGDGGIAVPGTFKFLSGFDNNKAIIHVVDVVFPDRTCGGNAFNGAACTVATEADDCAAGVTCDDVPDIQIPPDFHLSLQFNKPEPGWLGGNAAERGFTLDTYFVGGFGCNLSLGGAPFFPHASFFAEISSDILCETEYLAYQAVDSIAPAVTIPLGDRWAKDLTLALGDQACEISSLEVGFRASGTLPYTVDIDIRQLAEEQGRAGTVMQFTGEGNNKLEIARFRFAPGIFLPDPAWVTFSPSRDGVGIVQVGETQAGFSEGSFREIVANQPPNPPGFTWSSLRCIANGAKTVACPQLLDSIFYVRVKCRGTAPVGACCPEQKVPTTCVGGLLPGITCETDGDCMGGQCLIVDTPCVTGNNDCPLGSICVNTCTGGIHDGLTCFNDDDCVSDSEPTNTGTCNGASICDRAACFDNVPVLGCLNGRWQASNGIFNGTPGTGGNQCIDNPFIPGCGEHACCLPDNSSRNTRFEQCLRIKDPNSIPTECGQCLMDGQQCFTDIDCVLPGDVCTPNDSLCLAGQECQPNGICSPRTAIWNAGQFRGENNFTCPIYDCNFGRHDCLEEEPFIDCRVDDPNNPGTLIEDDDLCPPGIPCGNLDNFGNCVFGGCDNALCCDTVCSRDIFCCDALWDDTCVTFAEEDCPFIPPGNDDCLCKTCSGVPFRCDVDADCGLNQDGTQRTCEINNDICGSQNLAFTEALTQAACLPTSPSCRAFGESSNEAATVPPTDPIFCCNKNGPVEAFGSVWYRFIMPDVGGATSARFQTCNTSTSEGAVDSIIQIYEAADDTDRETACASLVTLGCNDDAGGTCGRLSDTCVEGLIVGKEYFITVASSVDNATGKYFLEVEVPCSLPNAPPANNDCVIAEQFVPPSVLYDLNNATISCPTVDQCPSFLSDVWFDYVPECTGILTVDTCGGGETNLTTAVAVYEVTTGDICPPDPILDFLDCSETPCATVSVPVIGDQVNTLYRIRVGTTAPDDPFNTTDLIGTLSLTCVQQDCQPNGVPDATDIADCPVGDPVCADCDLNLIPDICDINNCPAGDVNCADCNFNDVPDACDIANGLADNNGDGIPDICTPCTSPPVPQTWTSIGQHGPGCIFDPTCGGAEYGQDMPAASDYSESRSTGLNKIVIKYDVDVNVSLATVSVTGCAVDGSNQNLAGITMSVVASANLKEAVLLFSPSLPGNNPQAGDTPVKYEITVSGVTCDNNGGPGAGVIVDETRTAWGIFGDANASPITVNNGDLGFVRQARDIILMRAAGLQVVDPNSATGVFEIRADINNDNTVSNTDLGLVRLARDSVQQPTGMCP